MNVGSDGWTHVAKHLHISAAAKTGGLSSGGHDRAGRAGSASREDWRRCRSYVRAERGSAYPQFYPHPPYGQKVAKRFSPPHTPVRPQLASQRLIDVAHDNFLRHQEFEDLTTE